jgi:hypothetical protein
VLAKYVTLNPAFKKLLLTHVIYSILNYLENCYVKFYEARVLEEILGFESLGFKSSLVLEFSLYIVMFVSFY